MLQKHFLKFSIISPDVGVRFRVHSCKVPCSGYPSFVLQSLGSSLVMPEIWSALYLLSEPLICTAPLRECLVPISYNKFRIYI